MTLLWFDIIATLIYFCKSNNLTRASCFIKTPTISLPKLHANSVCFASL